jgi:DNA polymerase I
MSKHIIIFDGRNLLWRSYSVFQSLTAELPDGDVIPTGGLYGFLSLAAMKWRKFGGRAMVAWEGNSNYRYEVYPEYKKKPSKGEDEHREMMVAEIAIQEIRLKAVLRAMGVEQYKAIGGEADDVLATLAMKHVCANKENKALIYTGDSDLRQMVGNGIVVIAPGNKNQDMQYVEASQVVSKDGVAPPLVPDLKALAGDGSDNIPGVKGVGPATAQKLIAKYGDLEKVIQGASGDEEEWPVAKRFRDVIAKEEENLKLYKRLATVMTDCDMKLLKPKRDKGLVLGYLRQYRFASLLSPLELSSLMKMGMDE